MAPVRNGRCQFLFLRWQDKKHLSIIKNAQKQGLKSMKNNFKIVEKLQKTRKYAKKSIVKKLEKVINL